jgi:hypothetical protein
MTQIKYASFKMPATNAAGIIKGGGLWSSGDINLSQPSTWNATVFDPGGKATGYSGLSVWINGIRVAKIADSGEVLGSLISNGIPAKTTGFVGTVSSSGATITFSSSVDATVAEAGSILIAGGQTIYLIAISGTAATAMTVPLTSLSGTAITSLQTPIFATFDTSGALQTALFADGTPYYTSPSAHRTALNAMPAGVYTLTDGATIAVDWNNGATQIVTLGGTGRTVTMSNAVNGQIYRLIIAQDATGSRTITTWPTIKWAGGTAPTLTTTASKADIVTLLYAGGVYYADCNKNF